MRAQGLVAIVAIVISMALLMIILSQQQLLTNMYKETGTVPMDLERLGNEQSQLNVSKVLMEEMLNKWKKAAKDLEAEMVKAGPDMEKTKTEIDVCRAGKKTQEDELAAKEKELTETEATLKAESDAWNKEITNLKAQVTVYRPICDYVKEEDKANVKTLCGTKA